MLVIADIIANIKKEIKSETRKQSPYSGESDRNYVINWNVFILKNIYCSGKFVSHDKREWWCWKFDHKRWCLIVHQHIIAFIHYVTWYILSDFLYKNIVKYRMLTRIWRFNWVHRRHRKKTNTHHISQTIECCQ